MEIDHIRDIDEFINLYNTRPMPCQYELEWLINNPYLFCVYVKGKFVGYITIQNEELEELGNKKVLTLSGASIPKNMSINIQAIIKVCNAFNTDMYSYTPKKEAALVLRKAGFKKIKDKVYMRSHNG